jgi:hypothetical protein
MTCKSSTGVVVGAEAATRLNRGGRRAGASNLGRPNPPRCRRPAAIASAMFGKVSSDSPTGLPTPSMMRHRQFEPGVATLTTRSGAPRFGSRATAAASVLDFPVADNRRLRTRRAPGLMRRAPSFASNVRVLPCGRSPAAPRATHLPSAPCRLWGRLSCRLSGRGRRRGDSSGVWPPHRILACEKRRSEHP